MALTYKLFTQPGCAACPKVKGFMQRSGLNGEEIDVSTGKGFERAKEFKIISTPTVIFFNERGKKLAELFNVEGIKDFLSKQ